MPCQKIIVVTTYHLGADNLWDVCEPLVLKHSLDILLVLREACISECFCFLIFVLKIGQPQSHDSDVGNVRTVSSDLPLKRAPKLVELGQDSRSAYQELVERR